MSINYYGQCRICDWDLFEEDLNEIVVYRLKFRESSNVPHDLQVVDLTLGSGGRPYAGCMFVCHRCVTFLRDQVFGQPVKIPGR